MKSVKELVAMLALAAAVAIVVVAALALWSVAKAQTAYVTPVERWSPHRAPDAYTMPERVREARRHARKAKRYRERVKVWTPPHRVVAKVIRITPPLIPRCSHPVSAVGTEHYAEDDAKAAAIKSWMAEVRHRLGTEAMDINNAVDVAFRCVISTPGDRVSDKIAKWTRGDLLKECRIVATPCRPEVDNELPSGVKR